MSRLYGSLSYKDHHWVIKTEPQVALRIKRVFGRINKGDFGSIYLARTPESDRELLWFMERYPLSLSDGDRKLLESGASVHKERESLVASILAGDYKPADFDLAVPAREYQRQAADLLLKTGRLLLADDLGVGKTCSAICTLTDSRTLPVLVVTLTSLPPQWEREINKFMPKLNVHIVKKGSPYDLCKGLRGKPVPFPDVIIMNYHKLSGWAETLAPIVKSVIYDEAQELRHAGTYKYNAAKHVSENTAFKMGLTATPIYNYGGEIFNVLDAIDSGCLGSKPEFQREFCNDAKFGEDENKVSIKDPVAFGSYLREQGLMLRRTRAEVGRELPPLNKIPYVIDADTKELDRVGRSVAELAKIILAQGGTGFDKMKAGGELDWKLRQATGIAKAPFVADFVKLLVEGGEKVILYGWHHEVYSIWKDKLKDFHPAMYTGQESVVQKEETKRKFIAGESKILIMSLRAGAGVDGLQGCCRTIVFGELDWSPGVHNQCCGRVHRDGQTESVCAYYLMSESGSDPVIADVLNLKRQQSEGIINPNADLIEEIQSSDNRMKLLAARVLGIQAA